MTYRLTKLAEGSYDLWLDSRIVGSVIKGGTIDTPIWIAELLHNLPPENRPAPFAELEHEFATLDQVRAWLGIASDTP